MQLISLVFERKLGIFSRSSRRSRTLSGLKIPDFERGEGENFNHRNTLIHFTNNTVQNRQRSGRKLKQEFYCVSCVYSLSRTSLIFLDKSLMRNGF